MASTGEAIAMGTSLELSSAGAGWPMSGGGRDSCDGSRVFEPRQTGGGCRLPYAGVRWPLGFRGPADARR